MLIKNDTLLDSIPVRTFCIRVRIPDASITNDQHLMTSTIVFNDVTRMNSRTDTVVTDLKMVGLAVIHLFNHILLSENDTSTETAINGLTFFDLDDLNSDNLKDVNQYPGALESDHRSIQGARTFLVEVSAIPSSLMLVCETPQQLLLFMRNAAVGNPLIVTRVTELGPHGKTLPMFLTAAESTDNTFALLVNR